MIKLIFDDSHSETATAKVKYRNLETMNEREFAFSAAGFRRLWLSGHNGYWQVYYLGWHSDISISLQDDDVIIRVPGNKPTEVPGLYLARGAGMRKVISRLWAWAHTETGDLVCCVILGVPLGVALAWVTIVVACMDWWR